MSIFNPRKKEIRDEVTERKKRKIYFRIAVCAIIFLIAIVMLIQFGKGYMEDFKEKQSIAAVAKEEARIAASLEEAAEEAASIEQSKAESAAAKEASKAEAEASVQASIEESSKQQASHDESVAASIAAETYYMNHTYQLVVSDVTWSEAKSAAEKAGGHLATFTTDAEYEYVIGLLETDNEKREKNIIAYWVGARNTGSEDFKWVTGEAMTLTDRWGKNEPSNTDGIEHYMVAYRVKGVWVLNDAPDDISQYYSNRMGYIVEYDS